MADRPLCAPHVAPIPMLRRGQVQIINLGDTSKAGQIIDAHVTGLACISLNRQGTMLATASEKGTLLRVFDTRTSKQLFELRRGSTSVTITRFARKLLRSIAAFLALLCSRRRALLTLATGLLSGLVWICTTTCSINFSSDSSKIVVSSDKTTVHIFNLAGGASADGKKPANSGMMPTYFRCVRVWSTLVRLYKRSRHRFHRRFLGRRRRHGITPVPPPPRPPPPEGSCNHCITQPNRPSPLPTIVAASHNPTLSLSRPTWLAARPGALPSSRSGARSPCVRLRRMARRFTPSAWTARSTAARSPQRARRRPRYRTSWRCRRQ